LEKNRHKLAEVEIKNYSLQFEYITEICKLYETAPDQVDKIVDLMQKMQETGQPPPELVKQMAPDLELNSNGSPSLPPLDDKNCLIM